MGIRPGYKMGHHFTYMTHFTPHSCEIPLTTDIYQICDQYQAVLLDAYGVLVHSRGAMPGAVDLIQHFNDHGKPFRVVTNDSSRLPAQCSQRYQQLGLQIQPEQVITSGSLLIPWFRERGLQGCRTVVLGPADSRRYVELAGGEVVPATSDLFDVLVICDQSGFDFISTLDTLLTTLVHLVEGGRPPQLVLTNPDLIYPSGAGSFGYTSGAAALLLEAALQLRFPGVDCPHFHRLGKPYVPIFNQAFVDLGTRQVVMVGDQLVTDIAGARAAGIDSVLVGTGVVTPHVELTGPITPTWVVPDLTSFRPPAPHSKAPPGPQDI